MTTTTTITPASMGSMRMLLGLAMLLTLISIPNCECNWGTPDSSQYHIQTDEGPERYFRYQTDNGQYRKERRLEDGTVIGTEAWIDATGYLRQKDYIADNKGYRILKSKTVYVGQDRPIQEAIKIAKKAPASAGTLVNSLGPPRSAIQANINQIPQRRGGATYQSTSGGAAVANPLGYDHYNSPNDLVRSSHVLTKSQQPDAVYLPVDRQPTHSPPTTVYVTPKSTAFADASTPATTAGYGHVKKPALGLQTPFGDTDTNDHLLRTPIAVYASTPSPIAHTDGGIEYSTATYDPHASSGASPPPPHRHYQHLVQPGAVEHLSNHIESSTSRTPITAAEATAAIDHRNIHPTTYRPKLTYEPANPADSVGVRPIFDRSALRRQQPLIASNALGNGYDPQYPAYDGVSQTATGFQYYLPRQYHEEDSSADGARRTGSFGYVDPFGIRRVVYYNASPEGGFVHRKNNRFVGHAATPYDPRPL